VIDSPSDRSLEKASRWDRGCGKVILGASLCWVWNIWEFIEVELGQTELRGTHAPGELVALPYVFWPPPEPSTVPSGPEKTIVKFHHVWTLFGIDFLKSQKQAKKQQLALGTGLIG
jgi:hypothetical protein